MRTLVAVLFGLSIVIFATVTAFAQAPAPSPHLEGTWVGALDVGGVKLRLVFHIQKKADALTATMDSPDQGAAGIPMDSVTFADGKVRIEQVRIGGVYEGQMSADGTQIEGTWAQSGQSLPLALKRSTGTEAVAKPRRPQEPKKPFPYREETVAYENRKAGVKLAATLTLPRGKGPFPAVVLITGSGAQNRDESLMGHRPFAVLADYLTRRGIAVLRADDRGVGGSTGNIAASTTADFADDTLAGVAFLKARGDIHPRHIGLLGHSEGGLVAPLAAVRSKDVAFIVLLAGPGLPGGDIILAQMALIGRSAGMTEAQIATNQNMNRKLYALVREEKDPAAFEKRVRETLAAAYAGFSEEDRKKAGDPEAGAKRVLADLNSPWFRYFLFYDPRPTLRQVRCPVLAINGEKDMQVPPRENLREIASALKVGGNRNATLKEMPGLNHLLQTCKTGAPAEYAQIEETMSPSALKLIGDWILQRAGGR